MSEKDRHPEIENGTIGNLFRRMTLATLGLDGMDGVSDESFQALERADAFVDRLIGNISHVLPKIDAGNVELHATELSDHIFAGMSGLNGPKNATDLGEWQYWLDAALLMLFDEEEDEESEQASASSGAGVAVQTSRRAQTAAQTAAIRERVVALKNSGIKPAMLQSLSQSQKRAIVERFKSESRNVKSEHHANNSRLNPSAQESFAPGLLDLSSEAVAKTLKLSIMDKLSEKLSDSMNGQLAKQVQLAKDAQASKQAQLTKLAQIAKEAQAAGVFSTRPGQNYASRIADRVSMISAQLSDIASGKQTFASQKSEKVNALSRKWSESVSAIRESGKIDVASVREMIQSLDGLEEIGAISHAQATQLRQASSAYARQVFAAEVSRDVTAIAGHIESMAGRLAGRSQQEIGSIRAVSTVDSSPVAIETLKRSFATLNEKLDHFNQAVSQRVLSEGETAATMRWQRAADRFVRMQGVSDDVDLVLLRDVVESAAALGESGIVQQDVVNSLVSGTLGRQILAQKSTSGTGISSTNMVSSVFNVDEINSTIGGTHLGIADAGALRNYTNIVASRNSHIGDAGVGMGNADAVRKYANIGASRILNGIADKVENSVESIINGLVGTGVSVDTVRSFVSDVHKIVAEGRMIDTDSDHAMSVIKASSVIETLGTKLDEFARMAASSVVTHGYDELTSESASFVSTSEGTDTGSISAGSESSISTENVIRKHVAEQVHAAELKHAYEQAQMAVQSKEALASVRKLQSALKVAHEQAQNQIKAFAVESARTVTGQHQLLEALGNASSVQEMIQAQKSLEAHLDAQQKAELSRTIEAVKKTESHIQSVSRQMRVIENTVKLSEELKRVIASGGRSMPSVASSTSSVRMDSIRINPEYLPALGETLGTYAKMRNEIENIQTVSRLAGMSSDRLERMLSVIRPSETTQAMLSSHELSEKVARFIEPRSEISVGYDEVIPSAVNWVTPVTETNQSAVAQPASQSVQSASVLSTVSTGRTSYSYPSQEKFSGLSSVLGTKKAIEILSASVAGGGTGHVESLGEAISRWAKTSGHDQRQSYSSYGISDDGTQVKVSLELSKNKDTYSLRNEVGQSYQPASIRHIQEQPVIASLNVERAGNLAVSGADEFIPVMAGANHTGETGSRSFVESLSGSNNARTEAYASSDIHAAFVQTASGNGVQQQDVSSSVRSAENRGASSAYVAGSHVQPKETVNGSQQSIVSRDTTYSGILGGINIRLAGKVPFIGNSSSTSSRMVLNIGGVDFEMSSNDFVHMLAKPAMSSATVANPTIVNADNTIFSGYASLINEQGERRSLKSLRRAYIDSVAQSGTRSAHSEVGFSTQSFANILGVSSPILSTSHRQSVGYSDNGTVGAGTFVSGESVNEHISQSSSEAYRSSSDASSGASSGASQLSTETSSSSTTSEALAKFLMEAKSQSPSSYAGDSSFSWVSNGVTSQSGDILNRAGNQQSFQKDNNRQVLGRIDNLLDYVESMSTRDVGVFSSSDDTVRVLLETVASEGELGNKGLPKWRQKDTKTARIAEARELREALSKIGASPIQGTQRFNDRKFVSPNLFPDTAQAAPLFSGGSEGSTGSDPGLSAHASDKADQEQSKKLPDKELQFLAEDIYQRMLDSLDEELQRRRTE